MVSFLKKLFGGGGDEIRTQTPSVDAEQEHEGYLIKATLMRAGGEYQIAGTIEKEIDGELKTHSFIRADKFTDKEQCVQATLAKGRQIISEQGRFLFD